METKPVAARDVVAVLRSPERPRSPRTRVWWETRLPDTKVSISVRKHTDLPQLQGHRMCVDR